MPVLLGVVAMARDLPKRPVGLYLFCTCTKALWPILPIRRFESLRSFEILTTLVDQLPPWECPPL